MRALTVHGAGDLRVDERPRTDPGLGNFKLRKPMALGPEMRFLGSVMRLGFGGHVEQKKGEG